MNMKNQLSVGKLILRIFLVGIGLFFIISGFNLLLAAKDLSEFLLENPEAVVDENVTQQEMYQILVIVFITSLIQAVVGQYDVVQTVTTIGLIFFFIGLTILILSFRIGVTKKRGKKKR